MMNLHDVAAHLCSPRRKIFLPERDTFCLVFC
jgi:hypothetical protein